MNILYIFLGIASFIIVFGAYIPYLFDVLKGKAQPSRSTRLMFATLMIIAISQQWNLGSRGTLAVTIGEAAGSFIILLTSFVHGVDGLKRLDVVCYGLLIVDVFFWLTTSDTTLALHLTVLADFIAFTPTLVKTWKQPKSETPLFYAAGVIAPLMSVLAGHNYAYGVILFPVYLAIANALEVGLIYRGAKLPKPA